MTAPDPADVTEQAAKVALDALDAKWKSDREAIVSTMGARAWSGTKAPDCRVEVWEIARALHDAGLLADPADRDNAADQVTTNAVCHLLGERLRRAEAERDLLRAQVARVRELADRLDSPYSNPSVRYMSTRIREALDGAGEQ